MMICNPRKRGLSDAFGSPGAKQMRVGASCSPHKIAFLDLADHSARRAKRSAQVMGGEEGPQQAHKALRSFADANVPRGRAGGPSDMGLDSPFRAPQDAEMGEGSAADGENYFGGRQGGKGARLCRACKQRPGEHLFTSEDVQKIVERAVAKREGELRQEYDAILQQRQAENFSNFRRFHEDYVSRQLNQSDYSYMS